MARKFHAPVSGFSNGVNSEASVLNILPTELMEGTVNVVLHQNGSIERRFGVDFIGQSDEGEFLTDVRGFTGTEASADCPNAFFVRLSAPNGNLVERVILDINNTFLVYDVTADALSNFDTPRQTITRSKTHDNQRFYYMSYAVSGDKLFFAGRHSVPGYLKVDTDNVSLVLTYYDVNIRNPASLSSVITRYDKDTNPTGTGTYPTTVDHFAGRVWLSGDPRFPNQIYFSQVIVADSDISKFYQEADPNSATDPDLVDDDGGVITLQGAGLINQIISIKNSMFIGVNNGVWQITGGSGIFKATDFGSHKVLGDGVDGHANMIAIDEEILAFGQNSVWLSRTESNSAITNVGEAVFRSLSKDKIETLYTEIPVRSKASGKAVYNRGERKVYFYYDKDRNTFSKSFNQFDQPCYFKDVIVVDTNFQEDLIAQDQKEAQLQRKVRNAFTFYSYPNNASDGYPYITTPFICKSVAINNDPVIVDNDQVTVNGDNVVTSAQEEAKQHILCVALRRSASGGDVTIQGGFATFNTTARKDWESASNYSTRYTGRAITGMTSFGNMTIKKSPMYVYVVMRRIESGILGEGNIDITPGGCRMNMAWDYSTSGSSKYGEFINIYHPYRYSYSLAGSGENPYEYVYYKARVRGRGRTMRLEFIDSDIVDTVTVNFDEVTVNGDPVTTNTMDKHFHVIGYSVQFVGDEAVG